MVTRRSGLLAAVAATGLMLGTAGPAHAASPACTWDGTLGTGTVVTCSGWPAYTPEVDFRGPDVACPSGGQLPPCFYGVVAATDYSTPIGDPFVFTNRYGISDQSNAGGWAPYGQATVWDATDSTYLTVPGAFGIAPPAAVTGPAADPNLALSPVSDTYSTVLPVALAVIAAGAVLAFGIKGLWVGWRAGSKATAKAGG